MDVWVLIVAYVLLVVVSQLLIYRYLNGREGTMSSPFASDGAAPEDGDVKRVAAFRDSLRPEQSDPDDEGVRLCPQCGAPNDPGYTFCRSCVTHLGP